MTARFDERVPVKSCTLCRYGAPSWQPGIGQPPIYCAKRQGRYKGLVAHNEAADCDDYYMFGTKEQLLARRDDRKRRAHKPLAKPTFVPARGSIWD